MSNDTRKILYGSQIITSPNRFVEITAGKFNVLELKKVNKITTKGTTNPHVEVSDKRLLPSLNLGSSDISGSVCVIKENELDFQDEELCTVYFENHKTDDYRVFLTPTNSDTAKYCNFYVDKFSDGFTIMRNSQNKIPTRKCIIEFDYLVID